MTTYTTTTLQLEIPTNRVVFFSVVINAVTGEPIATFTNRDTSYSLEEYEELGGGAGGSIPSAEEDELNINILPYDF